MMNEYISDRLIYIVNSEANSWKTVEDISNFENQENPFFVCDLDNIIQKCKTWNALLPRIKPHYAVKCNDHPVVLKTIAAFGLGFDCASKIEINKILRLGVDVSQIIYAHPTKPPSHIKHASTVGVDLMTFDNETELYKIEKLFPNARLVIRIRCDGDAARCLGSKFGCKPYSEAQYLLKIARALSLNVVGVSFHVGWNCKNPSAYYFALKTANYVFDVASDLGYNFNLLDIGGGFPGASNSSLDELDIIDMLYKKSFKKNVFFIKNTLRLPERTYGFDTSFLPFSHTLQYTRGDFLPHLWQRHAKAINRGLDDFFTDQSVKVIAEPGTYFVDSAFTLACYVHSAKTVIEKNTLNDNVKIQNAYYINEGIYGSLNWIISGNVVKAPKALKKYPGSKLYPSVIWGPTCDSRDKIIDDALLPELQVGDWLIFQDVGAYTWSLGTGFNSFELPKVYSIISKNNWLQIYKKLPFCKEDFMFFKSKLEKKNSQNLL